MTSSIPKIPYGSIPYTQHHPYKSPSFGEIDNKSNLYQSYEKLLGEYVINGTNSIPRKVISTRILCTTPNDVDRTSSPLSAKEVVDQIINFQTSAAGQTFTLPNSVDIQPLLEKKIGNCKIGINYSIVVYFFNKSGGVVTLASPSDENVIKVSANNTPTINNDEVLTGYIHVTNLSPFTYKISLGASKERL